ncbi:hypothetical protein ACB098_01G295300 [Castanea mollissima]
MPLFFSFFKIQESISNTFFFHPHKTMSLTPLMFRSLLRLLTSLIGDPAASVSTLLFYSDLLPQNIVLERLVQHDLLHQENYLFHFLINFLRCFW